MAYEPTHEAPPGGLPAFAAPDPAPGSVARLDAGLDVQVLERREAWAHIVCSNGWEAWVDGRRLVERMVKPPPSSSVDEPQPSAASAPAAPAPAPTSPAPTPAPAATTPTPAAPSSGWTQPATTPTPAGPSSAWTQPATTPAASSGGWAQPSAPAPAAAGAGLAIGPGQIVALVGAALALISGWLNWVDFQQDVQGTEINETRSAYEVPLKFLIDNTSGDAGLQIGFVLFVLVAAIVVGVFVRQVPWLTILGGGLVALIALLFIYQVNNAVSGEVNDTFEALGVDKISLFDFMGWAPLLALIGGIGAVVGGALALARPVRR
jgi:hypothetical protein